MFLWGRERSGVNSELSVSTPSLPLTFLQLNMPLRFLTLAPTQLSLPSLISLSSLSSPPPFSSLFFFFIARKQECHAVESHKTLVMLCLGFNCVFSFVTLWTFLVSSRIFMGFLLLCLVLLCTFSLSSFPSSVIVFPVLISYTFSR